jgi:uncharacterized protein
MVDETAALEKALVDACLELGADKTIADDLRGFLEARGVAADDIAAIEQTPDRAGHVQHVGDVGPIARIRVYRALIRNGLLSVVSRLMPRTRARMNATCDGSFDSNFARFLDERGPHTHYLRDVPREFFDWARPLWESDARRSYLIDLGVHELTSFELASVDVGEKPAPVAEVELARPAVLSVAMRLVHYRWAVHELSDEPSDASAWAKPEQRAVALVGYRDANHAVHWLELTPLAARIVERLGAGDPLGVAITQSCADRGAIADLDEIAGLLADLGARGILLGGRPVTTRA